MITHVTTDGLTAICENEADLDNLIDMEEMLNGEKFYDCKDCNKVLTGKGRSQPPEDWQQPEVSDGS